MKNTLKTREVIKQLKVRPSWVYHLLRQYEVPGLLRDASGHLLWQSSSIEFAAQILAKRREHMKGDNNE